MLEFERNAPQKIRLNIEFESCEFVDYVQMAKFVEAIYNEQKFDTVENSLKFCSQKLKENFSSLSFLKMEIFKLEIVKNGLFGAKIEIKY